MILFFSCVCKFNNSGVLFAELITASTFELSNGFARSIIVVNVFVIGSLEPSNFIACVIFEIDAVVSNFSPTPLQ